MADRNSPGLPGLMAWLEHYQPAILRKAKSRMRLGGLGVDLPPGVGLQAPVMPSTASSGMFDAIKTALTAASQVYLTKSQLDAQKKILDLQIERARNGLEPLDIDPGAYGVPRVDVGVSGDIKQLALIGGGIIGGLWLLSILTGRRRR